MNNQIKYFYLRQDNANTIHHKLALALGAVSSDFEHHRGDPIGVVAYQRQPDGLVRWALATVNAKHDQFDKTEGRRIAAERLETEASVVQLNELQTKATDAVYMINRKLLELDWVPSRAVKAAKSWLFG